MFFLLLSWCLLLKSLNCHPDPAKWAVHLNQNRWPSGILFEKRTQVGYVNNNPDPPPRPPMRQKRIHCQGDGWERLLSALVMGCDQRVLQAACPAPIFPFLWESLWLHLLEDAAAPQGRRTESCSCFAPHQWLQSSWSGGTKSPCRSDVCCVLQALARGLQTAALTQPSSLPNPFSAPEGFHNKHSSEATLNLLKQNLFIRELGWMSEIIIIGGYLQQGDEKEW